jgi:SOS-response transcriptional repressor LexA
MEGLSERQKQARNIIETFWDREGYAPTFPEVAEAMGISVSTTVAIINAAIKKGYLKMAPGKSRTLRLSIPQ